MADRSEFQSLSAEDTIGRLSGVLLDVVVGEVVVQALVEGIADLRVRPAPSTAGQGGGPTAGQGGGPATGGGSPVDPDTAQGRVDAIVAELVGRERVRTALDPAWLPLAERLRAAWKPGWEALDAETSGHALGDSAFVRSLPGYLAMADRYGRGGRPGAADGTFGERRSEAGRVVDREAAAASQGSAPLPFPAERGENPWERSYEVLVEVRHAEDGGVERVAVRRSSGHAGLDRQALATARDALAAWGWRPPEGPRRTSVWAFVAVLGVVPPAPALGCPLDVLWTLRFDRCAYPLKKLASGRVEFLALE